MGETKGPVVNELIDTTEMYLRTIYELEEEGVVPLRARIAERLGQSGPTVSQTVARMERDGLVVVGGDRQLELTTLGHQTAVRVMRKHRLAERLLTDVIKLDWEQVHTEACRWEHVMSDLVEERLIGLLDHPAHDPYGNPIPGLRELGEDLPEVEYLDGVSSLPAHLAAHGVRSGQQARVVLQRIAEPIQVDVELLARFVEAVVFPRRTLVVEPAAGGVTVSGDGADVVLDLPDDVARHLFVTAD
jgi:DtxR family Mn-dependent transcriptional regulator